MSKRYVVKGPYSTRVGDGWSVEYVVADSTGVDDWKFFDSLFEAEAFVETLTPALPVVVDK